MNEASTESTPQADRRRSMPWRALVAATVAAAVVAVVALVIAPGPERDPASSALSVPVTTTDGGTTTLAELGGRPLVVNFFASWCPPCRAELPDLEQVHQQVGDDVRFVGVNVDYDESTWKSFVRSSAITYETVFEPQQDLLRAVGGKGMPTTALVSAEGELLHVHTGLLDDARLLDLLDEHGLR